MRSAQIRCGDRGQSGARRSIAWRWLLGLALLCVASGCGPRPAAGLRPLPLLTYDDSIISYVDSLQPTFRWEAFPRPENLKVDKAGRLAVARNPTYELRIWRAEDYLPAELVYARSRLTEPVHTVETPFVPDTLYLWTIRARFELNGEPRVMEWGGRLDGLKTAKVWPPGYYMFKTPSR
jgi:hypothetical protein